MATPVQSQQEFYQRFLTVLQGEAPDLTDDREGSIVDSIAGLCSLAAVELQKRMLDEFLKTFFSGAEGDDLEALAVDHFGDTFARPEASYAVGTVTFSRENDDFGGCLIVAGTIVKTRPNANGVSQRYETLSDVTMTGTTIDASVRALVAGPEGNAEPGEVNIIESTLLDSSIEVENDDEFDGGEDEEDDETYLQTIRDLILSLRGATKAAIEAYAKTVPGIVTATAIEEMKIVKEWDIADSVTVGNYFRIPYVTLYIADVNGTANQALINLVKAKIAETVAAGVRVTVLAAEAISINWTVHLTLDPGGPSYATLQSDPSEILADMAEYINDLEVGDDFIVEDATAAILAIWGPDGTGDLTDLETVSPVGDVSVDDIEKPVAGTMAVS